MDKSKARLAGYVLCIAAIASSVADTPRAAVSGSSGAAGNTGRCRTTPSASRRGAWYYSAEQDVGFCGALRSHATVLTRDPAFGEMAYGGVLTRDGTAVKVIPRDGLRVRLHVVRDRQRVHLALDRDGFARERPIAVEDDLSRIEFTLENRTGGAHQTRLAVAGLPAGEYDVTMDGRRIDGIRGGAGLRRVALPVGSGPTAGVTIVRRGA